MQKKISLLLVFGLIFLLVGCLGNNSSETIKKGTIKVAQPVEKETGAKITGAVITFNEQKKDSTGFSTQVKPGNYQLKIEQEGYEAWKQEVTIKAEQETTLTPKLTFTGSKEVETGPDWQETAQPSGLTGTSNQDYIKLSWDQPNEEVAGYKIYRQTGDSQPKKPFKVIETEDLLTENDSYTWIDPTVKKQQTYYYWLEAYNDAGVISKTAGPTSAIFVGIYSVTFDYQSSVSDLQIYLYSDLNDWQGAVEKLNDGNGDGVYDCSLELNLGKYKYFFVMHKWILPDNAEKYQDDGAGNTNAVAVVSEGESNYTFKFTPPQGFDVYLASEINGWGEAVFDDNWRLTDEDGNGTYTLTVDLNPGEYQYKYVIGNVVQKDSDADNYVDSDYGTVSQITVGE